MKYIIILLLSVSIANAQDIKQSLIKFNQIRRAKKLPEMVYNPQMQKSCDDYAKQIATKFEHSGCGTYECIAKIDSYSNEDPILVFKYSAAHWGGLMDYWSQNICVGLYKKDGYTYVVVRTY
ncbi:MAG: hypothetical protein OJF59_000240 [Cytophagales bacterium]|jgi:hypothetical protein|nr:hypothetical protein [Bacteroidota bacterium]MBS1981257.1 hypothetical protein [Bacteroidota bacterium]WHZ06487.1 MAG: hypothetical protein OJF59_000240 [Cytophagales bacterium]